MKMTCAIIREYGSNGVVESSEVPRPQPQAGEVLVKVHATGVNPIDWKIRDGAGVRMGLTLPITLGSEIVGTVEVCGEGVDRFQHGDAVLSMVPSGGFAEYAIVKAEHLAHRPHNLDFVQAAALPLAGTAAWQAIFDEAGLSAGQKLLVTNSSGGVGSLAVQFAKAHGAYVIAVASGRNEEFIHSLGADEFIDYTRRAFEDIVSDVDAVLDTMGGDTFQRACKSLRKGGIMVTVVAFPQDEAERFKVRVKRSFTVANASNLTEITRLVESGEVTPHIAIVLPFGEIREALALSHAGRARGKIVVEL